MNQQTLAPVDHPAAWTAKSLMEQADKWIYELTEEDVAELDAALQKVKAAGLVVPNFGRDQFPMPKLAEKLASYLKELNFGLGILSIKGFPVERYTKDQASAIFWGIGAHVGNPWAQNARGHLLGDIRDEGRDLNDPMSRGYQTTVDLDMHTDGADILGLLCLKQAPEGGENQLVSAVSVFNHMLKDNPEAVQHLLDTEWCIDWRGEQPAGGKPYYQAPLFTLSEGSVTCFQVIPYVESAQRLEEVPRLADRDREVIDAFKNATWEEELVVRIRQQPGDITFLNNHYHLHARSEYVDAEDLAEKRHLRRLWLETEGWANQRPKAMATLLEVSRSTWEKSSDGEVQMWDQL